MGPVRSDVEEIKKRANIVDVVSEYVTLRKTGVNYTGLCPFHKEKTPSFSVNVDKQIFYCFGCGEGGDVLAFLMKINSMTFPEALRHLAGKLGIVLSQESRSREGREQKSLREEICRINGLAADYFAKNLFSDAGKVARAYLLKRVIHDDVIKAARIGYSLQGWRNLRGYFEKQKVSPKLLEKAGLVVAKDDGDCYDRFRGRLMFPIEGLNGNVIAFGGRSLGDEMPKYLNSPESPVYVKGRNLFGLSRAKEEIRRKDEAIIVEGYFDALQLWNADIKNAVATLGTALTGDHLDLLRRYTRNIVVIFDSDEGGRNAVERSLKLFVAEKMHARIVILPDGYDPDSYVMKKGKDALEDQISRAQSLVDYYIDNIIGSRKGLDKSLDIVRNAVGFIVQVEGELERNSLIKRVSERHGIYEETLKSQVIKALRTIRKTGKEDIRPRKVSEEVDPVELNFIHLLIEYPGFIPVAKDEKIFEYLKSDDLKAVGKALQEEYRQGPGNIVRDVIRDVISGIQNGALKERLVRESPYDADNAKRVFADTIKKLKLRWFKESHKKLNIELRKAQEMDDENLCNSILLEKERLIKEEKELSLNHVREK